MELKIGRKYKASEKFVKLYSLNNEFIKLSSISNNGVIVECGDINIPVRLDFFIDNIIDSSKSIQSTPRTVNEWKTEQKEQIIEPKVEPVIIPVEPKVEPKS